MTISDRVTLVVIGSHFLASVYHALAYVYSTQAERRTPRCAARGRALFSRSVALRDVNAV